MFLPGPGDGVTNMMATFFTFGCFGGAGFAIFSLMGNGKKLEGCVACVSLRLLRDAPPHNTCVVSSLLGHSGQTSRRRNADRKPSRVHAELAPGGW